VRIPNQQLANLRAVAPFLQPGGSLVYSTCSLETEENEAVVAAFLRGAEEFGLMAEEKRLPFRDATDGAFAARLTRHPRNGGPVG
jgi:16S rRNA (cytosine967-C5)-methyltransferase